MALNILITGGWIYWGRVIIWESWDKTLLLEHVNKFNNIIQKFNRKRLYGMILLLLNNFARIDVIIHTAGMNSQDCANDPVAALEFNGVATTRLVTGSIKLRG